MQITNKIIIALSLLGLAKGTGNQEPNFLFYSLGGEIYSFRIPSGTMTVEEAISQLSQKGVAADIISPESKILPRDLSIAQGTYQLIIRPKPFSEIVGEGLDVFWRLNSLVNQFVYSERGFYKLNQMPNQDNLPSFLLALTHAYSGAVDSIMCTESGPINFIDPILPDNTGKLLFTKKAEFELEIHGFQNSKLWTKYPPEMIDKMHLTLGIHDTIVEWRFYYDGKFLCKSPICHINGLYKDANIDFEYLIQICLLFFSDPMRQTCDIKVEGDSYNVEFDSLKSQTYKYRDLDKYFRLATSMELKEIIATALQKKYGILVDPKGVNISGIAPLEGKDGAMSIASTLFSILNGFSLSYKGPVNKTSFRVFTGENELQLDRETFLKLDPSTPVIYGEEEWQLIRNYMGKESFEKKLVWRCKGTISPTTWFNAFQDPLRDYLPKEFKNIRITEVVREDRVGIKTDFFGEWRFCVYKNGDDQYFNIFRADNVKGQKIPVVSTTFAMIKDGVLKPLKQDIVVDKDFSIEAEALVILCGFSRKHVVVKVVLSDPESRSFYPLDKLEKQILDKLEQLGYGKGLSSAIEICEITKGQERIAALMKSINAQHPFSSDPCQEPEEVRILTRRDNRITLNMALRPGALRVLV